MDDLPSPRVPESPPPRVSTSLAGRGWIIAAAVMWSVGGLFAKAPTFQDWPTEARGPLLAFWRALFAGLLLLPLVRRPRLRPQLLPMGLCFAAMNLTYLTAMTLTTAANAIWLQSTSPWWVLVFGLTLTTERPTRADLVMLLFVGAGLALVLGNELQSQPTDAMQGQAQIGIAFGLASGISYAGVVMLIRSLRSEDPAWLVTFNHLVAAALLFPVVLYYNIWPHGWQLLTLAAFGLFQMALPYVCFAKGLKTISSQEATGIGLLEPLLLPIWVYLAWNEVPAWWTIAGGTLIFVGLALRYLISKREA